LLLGREEILLRNLLRLVLLLLVLAPASIASGVSTAAAQSDEWRQRDTHYFTILFIAGSEDQAERYAGFVDQVFDEITGAFGHRVATPISLRLYPDLERYYEANPRARGFPGVVAHADFRRNEVVVIVAQTAQQSEEEVFNNVRHELTHIIAADLSENRLGPGLHEGLAQYLEHPTPELDAKIDLLRTALSERNILPWSALDDRDLVYSNPEVSYPQSLSVIAFLAQRGTFAQLRDFLTVSASSSGYRSAMQRAFGASADDLEREWLDWLPGYLSGGYRGESTSGGYDLARAEELLRNGSYSAALQELEAAAAGLRSAGRDEEAARAEELIRRGRVGVAADELARQARDALVAADYVRAEQLAEEAGAAYRAIGDLRQEAVLAEYAERAGRGQRAAEQLAQAAAQAEALRYPQARSLADQAAAAYTELGNRDQAARALELRGFMDQRQILLGGILLLFGIGGAVFSIVHRLRTPDVEPW
jgi:hypothetical protein